MKNTILLLLVSSFILLACNESKPTTKTEEEPVIEKESVTEKASISPQKKPLNIENTNIDIKAGKVKFDDNTGVPSTDIYIHLPKVLKSVFLATDYGAMPIETADQRENYGIPKDADFAINAYYAGGGNLYYGVAKDNVLTIYRRYLEEAHPDNEDAKPEEFTVFKTARFFENEVEIEE